MKKAIWKFAQVEIQKTSKSCPVVKPSKLVPPSHSPKSSQNPRPSILCQIELVLLNAQLVTEALVAGDENTFK